MGDASGGFRGRGPSPSDTCVGWIQSCRRKRPCAVSAHRPIPIAHIRSYKNVGWVRLHVHPISTLCKVRNRSPNQILDVRFVTCRSTNRPSPRSDRVRRSIRTRRKPGIDRGMLGNRTGSNRTGTIRWRSVRHVMGVLARMSMLSERTLTGERLPKLSVGNKSLVPRDAAQGTKRVVLVRHGQSTWNQDSRVQGDTDESVLTADGIAQAKRCKNALKNVQFDVCFSSPISRARTTAEILWGEREEPIVYVEELKEMHLPKIQGLLNAEAAQVHPTEYRTWREEPHRFHVDGRYPVVELWGRSLTAWETILSQPGSSCLVVSHKSVLRSLVLTAMGLSPSSFRSIEIHNGGMCTFEVNQHGEPTLVAMNSTAHMHADGVYY